VLVRERYFFLLYIRDPKFEKWSGNVVAGEIYICMCISFFKMTDRKWSGNVMAGVIHIHIYVYF
jgi:hypothetical protein